MINVQINGRQVSMELDTGAPCGIINHNTLRKLIPNVSLQKSDRQFASYTKHRIICMGRARVCVTVGGTTRRLNLYVVKGDFDPLFGREWITHFANEINFIELFSSPANINSLTTTTPELSEEQNQRLKLLLNRYEDVFCSVAGKLTGPPASLHLKPGATPSFAKAREIPFALRDTYAEEIDSKIAAGFYERVEYSEWAPTTHVAT